MLRKESLKAVQENEPVEGEYTFYPTKASENDSVGYGSRYPNSYLRPTSFLASQITQIEVSNVADTTAFMYFEFDYPNTKLLLPSYTITLPDINQETFYAFQDSEWVANLTKAVAADTRYTLKFDKNRDIQLVNQFKVTEENNRQRLSIDFKSLDIRLAKFDIAKTDTEVNIRLKLQPEVLSILGIDPKDPPVLEPAFLLTAFWAEVNATNKNTFFVPSIDPSKYETMYGNLTVSNPLGLNTSQVLAYANYMLSFFEEVIDNVETCEDLIINTVLTATDTNPDNFPLWQALIDEYKHFNDLFGESQFPLSMV